MKKLLATIAIGITMLSAKANHGSALNLKMFDNGMFTVILDERPSYTQSRAFSVADIEPGYHKLKVIRNFKTPYTYYPVSKVVYKGWINIPARSVMYAQIDCHSQLDVMKVEPYFIHHQEGGCSNNEWENEGSYGSEYGDQGGYHGNGWGHASPPAPALACMGYENFMQLKNSIASRPFEEGKMEIAKQALAYNYFSATQITTLTHLFSFESNKLEFAKAAYGKTIDRENYFLVNDAFAFENSVSMLNEYIAGR